MKSTSKQVSLVKKDLGAMLVEVGVFSLVLGILMTIFILAIMTSSMGIIK